MPVTWARRCHEPATSVLETHMTEVAVVTGAARGIGRAIGERLEAAGMTVVGVDMADGLAETGFEPVQVNLTDPAGIAGWVKMVLASPRLLEMMPTCNLLRNRNAPSLPPLTSSDSTVPPCPIWRFTKAFWG